LTGRTGIGFPGLQLEPEPKFLTGEAKAKAADARTKRELASIVDGCLIGIEVYKI
jgi:hypothetical protein